MTSLIITPETIDLPPGSTVTLQYQTWEDYENLLNLRQDKAGIRIRYSVTRQEIDIMAPLPGHGKRVLTLADLVKVLLRHYKLEWEGFDPITLKQYKQGGIEPDTCFYIQNREAILGKERIDLTIDPAPDLAIEVDLSFKTDIADYLPIGIPEVWIYRPNRLLIHCLENQTYRDSTHSGIFSDFDAKAILPHYVELAWSQGSSVALREFEQSLRVTDQDFYPDSTN